MCCGDLDWSTACPRQVDGVLVLIDWSCSLPTLSVSLSRYQLYSVSNLLCHITDIKEVLLFPAMKPEVGTGTAPPPEAPISST
jgi:hypothetical protein